MQCYKCWGYGNTAAECSEAVDRGRECLSSRRHMTRQNSIGTEEDRATAREEYRIRRTEYNAEIRKGKRISHLDALDHDEWGQGYRLLVKRASPCRPNRMTDERQRAAALELFPTVDDARDEEVDRVETADPVRPFTLENKKAPGLDGVLLEIAKAAIRV